MICPVHEGTPEVPAPGGLATSVKGKWFDEWLQIGGEEEDKPFPRCFNHFLNPVTGKGLLGFRTASDWAANDTSDRYKSRRSRT